MAELASQTIKAQLNLTKIGISSAGARQLMSGQIMSDQQDRQVLARFFMEGDAAAGDTVRTYNLLESWPTK